MLLLYHIRCLYANADLFRGSLKSPTGSGRWVIDHQIHEMAGQAENAIIDLSNSPLKNEYKEVLRQTEGVFASKDYEWLKQVIIVADKKLLFAAEKI